MPMLKARLIPTAAVAATLLATAAVPMTALADEHEITVIFTRHAEKKTTTTAMKDVMPSNYMPFYEGGTLNPNPQAGLSDGANLDEVCYGTDDDCAEELNALGLKRAELLRDYLDKKGILDEIDAVYSSHKYRTYQTVLPTAKALMMDVFQLPIGETELSKGAGASECPTLEEIRIAAPGSTLLVAGHSGTLYDIMGSNLNCNGDSGLGLDISDDDAFPKNPEDGKVRDYGDLWTVVIKNGEAKLKQRVRLDFVDLHVVSKAK